MLKPKSLLAIAARLRNHHDFLRQAAKVAVGRVPGFSEGRKITGSVLSLLNHAELVRTPRTTSWDIFSRPCGTAFVSWRSQADSKAKPYSQSFTARRTSCPDRNQEFSAACEVERRGHQSPAPFSGLSQELFHPRKRKKPGQLPGLLALFYAQ
jgi:hypothetical protein